MRLIFFAALQWAFFISGYATLLAVCLSSYFAYVDSSARREVLITSNTLYEQAMHPILELAEHARSYQQMIVGEGIPSLCNDPNSINVAPTSLTTDYIILFRFMTSILLSQPLYKQMFEIYYHPTNSSFAGECGVEASTGVAFRATSVGGAQPMQFTGQALVNFPYLNASNGSVVVAPTYNPLDFAYGQSFQSLNRSFAFSGQWTAIASSADGSGATIGLQLPLAFAGPQYADQASIALQVDMYIGYMGTSLQSFVAKHGNRLNVVVFDVSDGVNEVLAASSVNVPAVALTVAELFAVQSVKSTLGCVYLGTCPVSNYIQTATSIYAHRIGTETNLVLSFVVYGDRSSYYGNANAALIASLITCVVIAAVVIAGTVKQWYMISEPLNELIHNMMSAAALRNEDCNIDESAIAEIRELQRAFVAMNDQLLESRAFIGQGFLERHYEAQNNASGGAPRRHSSSYAHREAQFGGSSTMTSAGQSTSTTATDATTTSTSARGNHHHHHNNNNSNSHNGHLKVPTATSRRKEAAPAPIVNNVTDRRCAIVVINSTNFLGAMRERCVGDYDFIESYGKLVHTIQREVAATQGVLLTMHGDHFIVAHNAATAATAPEARAAVCAVGILAAIKKSKLQPKLGEFSAGVAASDCRVGSLGSDSLRNFSVLGPAIRQAMILQRMTRGFKGASVLATESVIEGLVECMANGELMTQNDAGSQSSPSGTGVMAAGQSTTAAKFFDGPNQALWHAWIGSFRLPPLRRGVLVAALIEPDDLPAQAQLFELLRSIRAPRGTLDHTSADDMAADSASKADASVTSLPAGDGLIDLLPERPARSNPFRAHNQDTIDRLHLAAVWNNKVAPPPAAAGGPPPGTNVGNTSTTVGLIDDDHTPFPRPTAVEGSHSHTGAAGASRLAAPSGDEDGGALRIASSLQPALAPALTIDRNTVLARPDGVDAPERTTTSVP